jgi:CRP-like cAMP-binding protein
MSKTQFAKDLLKNNFFRKHFWSDFGMNVIWSMATHFKEVTRTNKKPIFKRGDKVKYVYVVIDGVVDVI